MKPIEAERKRYSPDGCVLGVTVNLPGITFHFVEDVDFVGADDEHLEGGLTRRLIKSRVL